MITGFFLFPIEDERKFFRKRFTRVLIPFVIWCAVYAFYYYAQGAITLQTALLNIAKIPVNYGTEVGHLWFVYMLMAIYLIAPVFSPWIVSGKPEEHGTLPGAVGRDIDAALHSPLLLTGMGRVLLECNANPLLLLRLHRLCRTGRLHQAILDGAFVAHRLARNRHGCGGLLRYRSEGFSTDFVTSTK